MRWALMALQVVLAGLFVISAVPKLTGELEEMRQHLGVAPWFWTITALWEIVGAAALIAGIKEVRAVVAGGLWLAAAMAGGVVVHLLAGDPPTAAIPAAVLAVLTLTVAALAWRRVARRAVPVTPDGAPLTEAGGR